MLLVTRWCGKHFFGNGQQEYYWAVVASHTCTVTSHIVIGQ
jgi:hypothetical protein